MQRSLCLRLFFFFFFFFFIISHLLNIYTMCSFLVSFLLRCIVCRFFLLPCVIFFWRFIEQMLIERSRDCHSHKPQPTLDTKRKRKRTDFTACKITTKYVSTREAYTPAPSSLSKLTTMLNRSEKKNKRTKANKKTPHTKSHIFLFENIIFKIHFQM